MRTLFFAFVALSLSSVACAWLPAGAENHPELDYNRVRLVYHNATTGNFLFRSDLPDENNTFGYPKLMDYFAKRASEAKIAWPNNAYLYDIAVLGDIEKSEVDFWADPKNKDKGELQRVPIVGIPISKWPTNFTAADQKTQALGPIWHADQLPTRVPKIVDVLMTKHARPYVLLVHCRYGCDRTGEMITAIRTHALGFNNMRQAYSQTCTDARCPEPTETCATMWWCLYLKYQFNRDLGNCTNYAKCDKSTCQLV